MSRRTHWGALPTVVAAVSQACASRAALADWCSMSRCRRYARPAASRSGRGVGLCAACWSKLSPIEKPYCARLGIPFVYDPGPGIVSMEAMANPPAYDRARAAVRYDEVARKLVLSFKYADRLDLAPMMGRLDGAGRTRTAGRRRRADAGAAALAAAVGAALQPGRGAGRRDFRDLRRPGIARCAQARARHPAAGRPVQGPARRQCAGRVPGAGPSKSRASRAAGSSWSTTC